MLARLSLFAALSRLKFDLSIRELPAMSGKERFVPRRVRCSGNIMEMSDDVKKNMGMAKIISLMAADAREWWRSFSLEGQC